MDELTKTSVPGCVLSSKVYRIILYFQVGSTFPLCAPIEIIILISFITRDLVGLVAFWVFSHFHISFLEVTLG